jgi:hypothetical protein
MGRGAGLLLILGLLLATPAFATYETVDTFEGVEGGEFPFEHAAGLAVNTSGSGGVPPGALYFVERSGGEGVVSYNANGEFLRRWGGFDAKGIAVSQATGYVYVLGEILATDTDEVLVYSPDGSQLIDSFAKRGAFAETFDEGPDKIHSLNYDSAIAVDSSGVVYISDFGTFGGARVVRWEPESPGDYEHYIYTGRENDLNGIGGELALDSVGNLYAGGDQGALKIDPDEPDTPICSFAEPKGGIQAWTVNPDSGEPFYWSVKDKKVHQLSCNSQGEFEEASAFTPSPMPQGPRGIQTMAFNPAIAYGPARPPGVLYGISAENPSLAYIFAPAEIHPPEVVSQSVSSVTTTTATLGAQINPKGSETRYAFQYLTKAEYEANEPSDRFAGATEAPLGGASLGSGQEALSAAASLVGLQPDTAYRFRVIATSHCDPEKAEEACEDAGEAQAFHTYPVEAPELPDDRAWELVSPVQKQGGEVIPANPGFGSCGNECKPASLGQEGFPMQSSPDGEAVVYEGYPFSVTEGAAIFNQYLARRTPTGWQTTILSPRLHGIGGYKAFDAELNQGVLYQRDPPTLNPQAPEGYGNLYLQETANPQALSPLLGFEPPNRSAGSLLFTYAGASADSSRHFFEANDALTGETPFAPEAVDPGQSKNNLYEWSGGQLRLVNVLPGNAETAPGAEFGSGVRLGEGNPGVRPPDFSHVISADGSRVFWSDEAGQLHVREDGESTIAIPDPGFFLTASPDGSRVLLSNGHLYELEGEEPTIQEIADLTEGEGGFEGILGQSEDLSRVYFVDTAVLTGEEENDHGAKAQAGKPNLYAWNEGESAFVATLDPQDRAISAGNATAGTWLAPPVQRTAQASPEGRWVAFLSRAPLSGYDNTGPCGNEGASAPCVEVFLYDSVKDQLSCPSCNPSGASPLGRSNLPLIQSAKGASPQPRYLTDQGRLYFDTQDSLTPFDTNEGVEDVYQHEPEGVGSCKREGGCVNLVSAGHEPFDSNLLTIDATGKNIFFTSRDQLVLKDRDELIDLYVAREGGGIPSETETGKGECQGEACQPPVVVPNDPTPASSNFEGSGNVTKPATTKCSKGKVRRRGRCVRKPRKHRNAKNRAANRNGGGAR